MTAKLRALAAGEHAGGGLRCGCQLLLGCCRRRCLPASHCAALTACVWPPCPLPSASRSERVAAVSTLATFLSYLTFTRAGCCASDTPSSAADGGAAAPYDGSHPVDAAAALEAAAAASDGGALAWTLPWVLRYLWFLRWSPEAAATPYFRRALL